MIKNKKLNSRYNKLKRKSNTRKYKKKTKKNKYVSKLHGGSNLNPNLNNLNLTFFESVNNNNNKIKISNYLKYFKVTQATNDSYNIIFYPIFKKYIITNIILLLKKYKQFIDGKKIYICNGAIKNFKKNNDYDDNNEYIEENKIFNNWVSLIKIDDNFRTDKTIIFNEKINNEINEINKNIKFDKNPIIINKLLNFMKFVKNNYKENVIIFNKYLELLYYLLDYKKIVIFEEFKINITTYIDSLYNSEELNMENLNTKTKKIKELEDILYVYREQLDLYIYIKKKPINCEIYFVELNDIIKKENQINKALSMFVFIPHKIKNYNNEFSEINESNTNSILVSKHFLIVKDIINYILYEIKIKKNMIKYSSIILHSFCTYFFKESFFITTPVESMEYIFDKYSKNNDTIKILNDYKYLKEKQNTNNTDRQKILDFNKELEGKITKEELLKLIENVKINCNFSYQEPYSGKMVFNVMKFNKDWVNLIDNYVKQVQDE